MDKMCVYCESVFTSDTIVCPNCNEYDGMMPLEKAIDYLDLDPNDYELNVWPLCYNKNTTKKNGKQNE